MYSCTISGMSREMMKMDGRDSAECQTDETRQLNKLNELKDKSYSVLLH